MHTVGVLHGGGEGGGLCQRGSNSPNSCWVSEAARAAASHIFNVDVDIILRREAAVTLVKNFIIFSTF